MENNHNLQNIKCSEKSGIVLPFFKKIFLMSTFIKYSRILIYGSPFSLFNTIHYITLGKLQCTFIRERRGWSQNHTSSTTVNRNNCDFGVIT